VRTDPISSMPSSLLKTATAEPHDLLPAIWRCTICDRSRSLARRILAGAQRRDRGRKQGMTKRHVASEAFASSGPCSR